jgi:hypothetical protein
MPRLRERREFRRVRTADDPRPGFRVVCGDPDCKRSAMMHSNKWLKMPNEKIEKYFEEQNWFIGRDAEQDRCPEHSYRYRHERAHSAKEKATIEAKQAFAQAQDEKERRLEFAIEVYARLTEEEQEQFCLQLGLMTAEDACARLFEPDAEPAESPDAPPEPVEPGIPFMITHAMKETLRELGRTDEEIRNMLPAQAHHIIAEQQAPAPKPNGKPIEAKIAQPPPPPPPDDEDDDMLQASDIEDTANIIFGRR